MDVRWDIRRCGRAWSADELRIRRELLPEKLEVIDGKLLWTDMERLKLLGLLLENVGAEQVVELGDRNVWISAALGRRHTFLGDPFNRWMLLLLSLELFTLASIAWLAPHLPPPGPTSAAVVLGLMAGAWTWVAIRLQLDD